MKPFQVIWRVETPQQLRVEALEPRDLELARDVGGLETPGVERACDRGQRGSPVGAADRLGTAVDPRDRGVAAAGGGHRDLRYLLGYVRHVASHSEDHLVARRHKPGLDAGQRT